MGNSGIARELSQQPNCKLDVGSGLSGKQQGADREQVVNASCIFLVGLRFICVRRTLCKTEAMVDSEGSFHRLAVLHTKSREDLENISLLVQVNLSVRPVPYNMDAENAA